MNKLARLATRVWSRILGTDFAMKMDLHNHLLSELYVQNLLNGSAKYNEAGRLGRCEHTAFCQNGEDGILAEIFRRVGTGNRVFVEFGAQNGIASNSSLLLCEGWSGFWIEAMESQVDEIRRYFSTFIGSGKLSVKQAFITAENIEELFAQMKVPAEFDYLSVDIDGNDYWVWKAIQRFSPRVVSVEYNGVFPAHVNWVMPYAPQHSWDGTNYYGASLKALENLGRQKGYSLVGCNLVGVNAFFVRNDLLGDRFCAPFTAENHYEPRRYFLCQSPWRYMKFGPYVEG